MAVKKKIKDYGTGIPQYEIETLARCLLPEIQKYFESVEGQREYKAWMEKRELASNDQRAQN